MILSVGTRFALNSRFVDRDLRLHSSLGIFSMKAVGRIWRFVVTLSPLRVGVLLFATAFLVRLAFILVYHPYLNLGRYELERIAISLAATGVYGNPYAVPTGPSAHVSPGYALILAGLFRIFGTGVPAEIVKELLAVTVTSISCALLPAIAGTLRLGRDVGIVAGFVSALYPERPLVQVDGDWETPYTVLALMLISVLAVRLWKKQRLNARSALLHGLCWGTALLFVGALLPLLGAFIGVGAFFCRPSGVKRYLAFSAMEILMVGVCLAPWAIRNYYALGWPIFTRSNFGLELRVSNNDGASPNERVNSLNGVYAKFHPLLSVAEATKVREMGEVAYNRMAFNEAQRWILTHPGRFVQLCLGRARYFWFYTDRTSPVKTLFLAATALMGFIGLGFVFSQQPVTAVVLAIVLIIYPLPNYLVHVGLRQQYPIQWLMTLLTVFLIMRRRRRATNSEMPSEVCAKA
jgi:hypothetical protein